MARSYWYVFLCLICAGVVNIHSRPVVALPLFTTEADILSNTGYTQLYWEKKDDFPIEVQQATNLEFGDAQTIYQGNNTSLFLSGLKNGEYFYRLRSEDGTFSEPISLKVKHDSIQQAWLLFTLGAMVFGSIVFVILNGERGTV